MVARLLNRTAILRVSSRVADVVVLGWEMRAVATGIFFLVWVVGFWLVRV